MTIDIKHLHKSKTFRGVLIGIVSVIVLLVVFQAGMAVGFHKAAFSYKFGDNYYHNFGRPGNMMGGMMRGFDQDDLPGGHGAFGKVVRVSLPTIVVASKDNVEKIVSINDDTIIHKFRDTITAKDILVDDAVVIIGNPDDKGQVVAKFIRILPQPPEMTIGATTSTANMTATSTIKK